MPLFFLRCRGWNRFRFSPPRIPGLLYFSSAKDEMEVAQKYMGVLRRAGSAKPHLEGALGSIKAPLSNSLVLKILHRSAPENTVVALRFFLWSGQQSGYSHNSHTYKAACSILGIAQNPSLLQRCLSNFEREQYRLSMKTFRIMLGLCKEAKAVRTALELLKRMEDFDCLPDVAMYNEVIVLLIGAGGIDKAKLMLNQMLEHGLLPNMVTYVELIKGLCSVNRVEEAENLIKEMRRYGCVPNVIVYSAFLNGVVRARGPDKGLAVLETMVKENFVPNVVTYTCLIQGFCERGRLEEALRILRSMLDNGCAPNAVTCKILINASCMAGKIVEAYAIIDFMTTNGFMCNRSAKSILILYLLRNGNIKEGERLLQGMLESVDIPDNLACSVLIEQLCYAGRVLDALDWYHCFQRVRCSLDKRTLNFLVKELHKDGYIKEAASVFEGMEDSGLVPNGPVFHDLNHCINTAGGAK